MTHLSEDEHIEYKEEIMGMFGPRMGSWSIHSNLDPRWNKSGRAKGLCVLGGPQEMRDWIEGCKKKYGKPPEDATESFMKD